MTTNGEGNLRRVSRLAAIRALTVLLVGVLLSGCPDEKVKNSNDSTSEQNKKSGAGDDRRLLQDISGAERNKIGSDSHDLERGEPSHKQGGGH